MIEEPVPTMPEMVPATRPTARTKRKDKDCNSETDGMLKIVVVVVTKKTPNRNIARRLWLMELQVVRYFTLAQLNFCKDESCNGDLGWFKRSAALLHQCWLLYEGRPQSWSKHAQHSSTRI